jgi:uncharacterized protein (DUF1778 family)
MRGAKAAGAVSIKTRLEVGQDAPIDRVFFAVDAETFAKFQALIDAPLPPNDQLRRLLQTRAPWEP